jgi:hypothetical protein
MSATTLSFVLADRMAAAATEFDALCSAAGFDARGAQAYSAVYAGPTASERKVAAQVAERLWLTVSVEPRLSDPALGVVLDVDVEAVVNHPPTDPARPPTEDTPRLAAKTALEIAHHHRASHVAVVIKSASFQAIADDLPAIATAAILRHDTLHTAVRTLQLDTSLAAQTAITALLEQLGADRIAHPGGTLLAHLQRTAQRLASWHERPELIAAGHCHALYGTDGFPHALLSPSERPRLAKLVGAETEALVYTYASCDRSAGYPLPTRPFIRDRFTNQHVPLTPAAIRDLLTLVRANELDILLHDGDAC